MTEREKAPASASRDDTGPEVKAGMKADDRTAGRSDRKEEQAQPAPHIVLKRGDMLL